MHLQIVFTSYIHEMKHKNSTKYKERLLSRGGLQHFLLNEEKPRTKLNKKYIRFEDLKKDRYSCNVEDICTYMLTSV